MPQLVKGGKFVFGLSKVGPKGSIVIPPQAMSEYGFKSGDNIIIMSGSRRSGGFGLTRRSIIEKSRLSNIIDALPDLFNHRVAEYEIVTDNVRLFCWTTIQNNGYIKVPPDTLSRYGISTGNLLAVVRGSHLSIGFIVKGPIMEECLRHPELQVFSVK